MFSLHTTAILAKQMIRAIQHLHTIGILHRDVKPGNFCIGRDTPALQYRPICHLIDFGLSRRFMEPGGTIRQARTNVGFRGTARYASLAAHQGRVHITNKELGRVDDLWSLFYMLVEFLTGSLPWKGHEKDKIEERNKCIPIFTSSRVFLSRCFIFITTW